jgi:hypothetical protein
MGSAGDAAELCDAIMAERLVNQPAAMNMAAFAVA